MALEPQPLGHSDAARLRSDAIQFWTELTPRLTGQVERLNGAYGLGGAMSGFRVEHQGPLHLAVFERDYKHFELALRDVGVVQLFLSCSNPEWRTLKLPTDPDAAALAVLSPLIGILFR